MFSGSVVPPYLTELVKMELPVSNATFRPGQNRLLPNIILVVWDFQIKLLKDHIKV